MSEHGQKQRKKTFSRRSLIQGGATGVAAAAATLAAPKAVLAVGGGRPLTIEVVGAVFTSGLGVGGLVDNFIRHETSSSLLD